MSPPPHCDREIGDMAHGFRCAECDCQEAEHQYNDQGRACGAYQSPDPKAEALLWKRDSDDHLTDAELQSKYRIPGVYLWRT